jgi:diguanylate cyclase (GGDEF)-like protein/PAS domain S-box-containing protein
MSRDEPPYRKLQHDGEPDVTGGPDAAAALVDDTFRNAFEAAVIGMAIVGLDGTLLHVNQALTAITGYSREELLSASFQALMHSDEFEPDLDYIRRALDGEIAIYRMERRFVHRAGHAVWIELAVSLVRDADAAPIYFIYQMTDITDRKRFEDQLLHQAFHDSLTGLPNRALFVDRLDHALARARRPGTTVAVIFLDLDNFKVINDGLGHRAGDQLLVTIGERLQRCVRPGDTVARLGGDEFVVLLEDISDMNDAVLVAQRIAEQSLTLYTIRDRQVAVTASLGIAVGSSEQTSAEDLIRNADNAMYEAKRKGRARYELFTPTMTDRARDRLELEIELQRAMERGEFVVHYQPVFDLATRRVVEVEALVRWEHPEPSRGTLLPEDFIMVADETGLIAGIGDWVLREACRQIVQWQQQYPSEPPLRMSVNLSPRQLLQTSLVEDIDAILGQLGLDPRSLRLVVTERVTVEDADLTLGTLRKLRALGVALAIDDFGIGYSSLAHIRRAQIDAVKIDRSFVAAIGIDAEGTAMVDTFVAIARTLGINVIAEGIETQAQLDYLLKIGCGYGQGALFSEPLDAESVGRVLSGSVER